MALEQLLEQQTETPAQPQPEPGAARAQGSLLQQVRALLGQSAAADAGRRAAEAPAERVVCADGYVRRSPVQPYYTPEDFGRRRTRRIILYAVGVVFVVLVVTALVRSGWIRLH